MYLFLISFSSSYFEFGWHCNESKTWKGDRKGRDEGQYFVYFMRKQIDTSYFIGIWIIIFVLHWMSVGMCVCIYLNVESKMLWHFRWYLHIQQYCDSFKLWSSRIDPILTLFFFLLLYFTYIYSILKEANRG